MGNIISNPVFQVGIFGIVLGTIALLLALRARAGTHPAVVARGARIVLALAVLGVLLVSGWSGWNALAGQKGSVSAPSPLSSISQATAPTAPPTQAPSPRMSPTSTPTGTIAQLMSTFCDAWNAGKSLVAWEQYSTALQQKHSQQQIYAGWRSFTYCRVTDQSAEPTVFTVIALKLAPSANSLGSTGDYQGEVFFEFADGIENQQWKITSICQIIAESCNPIDWD